MRVFFFFFCQKSAFVQKEKVSRCRLERVLRYTQAKVPCLFADADSCLYSLYIYIYRAFAETNIAFFMLHLTPSMRIPCIVVFRNNSDRIHKYAVLNVLLSRAGNLRKEKCLSKKSIACCGRTSKETRFFVRNLGKFFLAKCLWRAFGMR